MNKKLWKPVLLQLIGGCVCGAILGLGSAFCVFGLCVILFDPQSTFARAIIGGALVLWVPCCTLILGYALAKREYQSQLESARLHSHFCKRCGYDLRGSTDIVCPECGTGISDNQRKHIEKYLKTPTE
jgi:hypothetical protein